MARRPLAVSVSRRIYRWMLRAYPRGYRSEWAGPMEQLFADCAHDTFARSGSLGLLALWCRTLWDYACSLGREYRSSMRRRVRCIAARPTKPWHNFTPRAGNALALARQAAERLGHDFVGPEHLLLGIVAQRDNVAVRVLRNLRVDPLALAAATERAMIRAAHECHGKRISFTPYAKQSLGFAAREAKSLGHSYLGCEHLLVGLTRDAGVAHDVLAEFGVTAERCIAEIKALLEDGGRRPPLARYFRTGEDHGVRSAGPQRWVVAAEGRFVRQNATENVYGHVALVLVLSRTEAAPVPPAVTFEITAQELPTEQWPAIEQAIVAWWRKNASDFGRWQFDVRVSRVTRDPAATPAYDQAAVIAVNDAIAQAIAAGVLPKPAEEN